MSDIDKQRVELTHEKYEEARRSRDAFWVEHADVLDQYQELCEKTNMALKKFEQACRETQVGAGPVSIRITNQPVFNISYLEQLLEGEDEIRNELIVTKVTKKVRAEVFNRLAKEGYLGKDDVAQAVERVEQKVALFGVPKATILQ